MLGERPARAIETAEIVAPEHEVERWPELREIRGGHLGAIPEDELEEAFVHAFRGVVPEESRFLGGESVGSCSGPRPSRARPAARGRLGHGARRAARRRQPRDPLWALTGQRLFLGPLEQAAGCINVLDVGDEWIVRAVNVAPLDLVHLATRLTQMEHYWHEFLPYRERTT